MSLSYLRKYDDASAPTLTGQAGSLIALLKAVLVNGYGAKSGLGWTLEYENVGGTIAVFRNNPNEGTGTYLRVSHDVNAVALTFAKFESFESMVSLTSGLNRCPQAGYESYQYLSESADAQQRPWRIIGDDKGFWLLTKPWSARSDGYQLLWMYAYVGDYVPYDIDNRFNFAHYCDSTLSSSGQKGFVGLGGVSDYCHIMRDANFGIGSVRAGMSSGSDYEYGGYPGWSANIVQRSGITLMAKPHIHTAGKAVVGILPGFFIPLVGYTTADGNIEEKIVGGTTFQTYWIRTTTYGYTYAGRMILTTGEGFRDVI